MKFQLEIELGNDAMQTLDDVITALKASRKSLADGGDVLNAHDRDILRDENGNTVGSWKVVK